jgi:hypothetical protein
MTLSRLIEIDHDLTSWYLATGQSSFDLKGIVGVGPSLGPPLENLTIERLYVRAEQSSVS